MKQTTINGRVFTSIWKTENKQKEPKENSQHEDELAENRKRNRNYSPFNHIGYHDPTASAALNNIMREERRKKRKK